MKTIERTEYLQWLERWKDKQIIKVVSGVRRCGKSTLFEIYKNKLLKSGVKKEQIISINFEDFAFENLTQAKALYEYITPLLLNDEMNYIFLDEIQHVDQFHRVVDSLFVKENTD